VTLEEFASLPGTRLRSGRISIPAGERLDLAAVLGSAAPTDALHPLHAYIAMQRGIGESIEDLCHYADFEMEDGPMMGSLDLEVFEDLQPDTEYTVEGELVDLVRKHGSRFTFDLMTFREHLYDASGREVARTTNTFVLPRIPKEER